MKKRFAPLVILAIIFIMTACGNKSDNGILQQNQSSATIDDVSDSSGTVGDLQDEQDNNARPELASHVENMDQYDTIVLIYPNWWGTLPMPLYTFLEEYDFSGKTILPLCTHEGSRMGSSASAIAGLCPDAILLDGLAVRGSAASSAQSDVETWISNSGILQ